MNGSLRNDTQLERSVLYRVLEYALKNRDLRLLRTNANHGSRFLFGRWSAARSLEI